jgi:hypothetical protein
LKAALKVAGDERSEIVTAATTARNKADGIALGGYKLAKEDADAIRTGALDEINADCATTKASIEEERATVDKIRRAMGDLKVVHSDESTTTQEPETTEAPATTEAPTTEAPTTEAPVTTEAPTTTKAPVPVFPCVTYGFGAMRAKLEGTCETVAAAVCVVAGDVVGQGKTLYKEKKTCVEALTAHDESRKPNLPTACPDVDDPTQSPMLHRANCLAAGCDYSVDTSKDPIHPVRSCTKRPTAPEDEKVDKEPKPTGRKPPVDDETRPSIKICCKAMTAGCLACARGVSKDAFCADAKNKGVVGCEPIEPPTVCCKAMTADCMSCAAGVTVAEFCAKMPTANGCKMDGPAIPPIADGIKPPIADGTMRPPMPPIADGTMRPPMPPTKPLRPPIADGTMRPPMPPIADGTMRPPMPPIADGTVRPPMPPIKPPTPPIADGTMRPPMPPIDPPMVGGCAGTRHGCCEDTMTSKMDKVGSNCMRKPTKPDITCCMAMTATCLACREKVTKEEFCGRKENKVVAGCESIKPPTACCKAMTADCMSCAAGVTVAEFCAKQPKTNGCKADGPTNPPIADGTRPIRPPIADGTMRPPTPPIPFKPACRMPSCLNVAGMECPEPASMKALKDAAGCAMCPQCVDDDDKPVAMVAKCNKAECRKLGCIPGTSLVTYEKVDKEGKELCCPKQRCERVLIPIARPPIKPFLPPMVGGCASTRHGCCEDKETSKTDMRGSNCISKPTKPTKPPTACCKAMTADCMSCAAGVTVAEFCAKQPKTNGCEADGPANPPIADDTRPIKPLPIKVSYKYPTDPKQKCTDEGYAKERYKFCCVENYGKGCVNIPVVFKLPIKPFTPPMDGGCASTQHGCCEDKKTSKSDKAGSNCDAAVAADTKAEAKAEVEAAAEDKAEAAPKVVKALAPKTINFEKRKALSDVDALAALNSLSFPVTAKISCVPVPRIMKMKGDNTKTPWGTTNDADYKLWITRCAKELAGTESRCDGGGRCEIKSPAPGMTCVPVQRIMAMKGNPAPTPWRTTQDADYKTWLTNCAKELAGAESRCGGGTRCEIKV